MKKAYTGLMVKKLTRPRPKQGERLLQLRLSAGLSQKELADLIGETQQNIAHWAQAAMPPRSDTLPKLAKVLGVRVEDILAVDGAPPKKTGPTQNWVVSGTPAKNGRVVFSQALTGHSSWFANLDILENSGEH